MTAPCTTRLTQISNRSIPSDDTESSSPRIFSLPNKPCSLPQIPVHHAPVSMLQKLDGCRHRLADLTISTTYGHFWSDAPQQFPQLLMGHAAQVGRAWFAKSPHRNITRSRTSAVKPTPGAERPLTVTESEIWVTAGCRHEFDRSGDRFVSIFCRQFPVFANSGSRHTATGDRTSELPLSTATTGGAASTATSFGPGIPRQTCKPAGQEP